MNPFARPFACPVCRDTRLMTRTNRAAKDDLYPCQKCGTLLPDEYDRFTREAWVRNHLPPEICEVDLSEAEFKVFKMYREHHPNVSKATILMWMEAARYDPAKDEEWLAKQARPAFKAWAAGRKLKNAISG